MLTWDDEVKPAPSNLPSSGMPHGREVSHSPLLQVASTQTPQPLVMTVQPEAAPVVPATAAPGSRVPCTCPQLVPGCRERDGSRVTGTARTIPGPWVVPAPRDPRPGIGRLTPPRPNPSTSRPIPVLFRVPPAPPTREAGPNDQRRNVT